MIVLAHLQFYNPLVVLDFCWQFLMINKQTKIADKNSMKSSKSKSQEIVNNNFNFSLQLSTILCFWLLLCITLKLNYECLKVVYVLFQIINQYYMNIKYAKPQKIGIFYSNLLFFVCVRKFFICKNSLIFAERGGDLIGFDKPLKL